MVHLPDARAFHPRVGSHRTESATMCLGTPGQIVRFDDASRQQATVDFAGTHRAVNTAMVIGDEDPPGEGDWVMVHMGIALHRVDPAEAADTQTFFDDLLADFERVAAAREDEAEGGS